MGFLENLEMYLIAFVTFRQHFEGRSEGFGYGGSRVLGYGGSRGDSVDFTAVAEAPKSAHSRLWWVIGTMGRKGGGKSRVLYRQHYTPHPPRL